MNMLVAIEGWIALFSISMGCLLAYGIVLQTKSIVFASRQGMVSKPGWAYAFKYGSVISFCWVLYQYSADMVIASVCFGFGFFGYLTGHIVARRKSLR